MVGQNGRGRRPLGSCKCRSRFVCGRWAQSGWLGPSHAHYKVVYAGFGIRSKIRVKWSENLLPTTNTHFCVIRDCMWEWECVCVHVYVCMCLHVCERVCLFHNPQKSNNNSNSSTHRDTHMHKTLLFGTHKKKQSVKFHFIFTPLPLSLPPTRDTIVPSPSHTWHTSDFVRHLFVYIFCVWFPLLFSVIPWKRQAW